jgi:molybdopterin converting factor small subunit
MDAAANIRVKVLFFGAVADMLGMRSAEMELPAGTDGRSAFEKVVRQHSPLAGRRLLYAVNEQYTDGAEALSEGDRLAIFTAVSGG